MRVGTDVVTSDEQRTAEQRPPIMKSWKLIAITVACTAAAIVASLGVGDYFANRGLRHTDVQGLGDLFKAGVSEAVTREAATPFQVGTELTSPTLVADLPPEEIKKRAQLADTYASAAGLALALTREMKTTAKLPETSRTLTSVPSQSRADAWGHPFCLFRINNHVVVVSAGVSQDTFPGCAQLTVNPMDAAHQANGLLYRYPSGRLVLVAKAP